MPVTVAQPQPRRRTDLHPNWHPRDYQVGEKKTFTLRNFQITNTRTRYEDTLFISASLAVGKDPPQSVSRSLGNYTDNNGIDNYIYDNGISPLDISLSHVAGNDSNIVFSYIMVNAGNANGDEILLQELKDASNTLASITVQAAAEAGLSPIGAALGASIGTGVVPLLGSALGALAGWISGQLSGLILPNCDGPVAAAVHVYKGSDITHPLSVTEYHPGTEALTGCGSNSEYYVTYSAISSLNR